MTIISPAHRYCYLFVSGQSKATVAGENNYNFGRTSQSFFSSRRGRAGLPTNFRLASRPVLISPEVNLVTSRLNEPPSYDLLIERSLPKPNRRARARVQQPRFSARNVKAAAAVARRASVNFYAEERKPEYQWRKLLHVSAAMSSSIRAYVMREEKRDRADEDRHDEDGGARLSTCLSPFFT